MLTEQQVSVADFDALYAACWTYTRWLQHEGEVSGKDAGLAA